MLPQKVDTSNFAVQYNYRFPDAIYDESGNMVSSGKFPKAKPMYNPSKL